MRIIRTTQALLVGAALLIPSLASADWFGRDRHEKGSGNIVSELRELPSFTEIDLSGSCDLRIQIGPEQKVEVWGDDNLIDRIRTEVTGGDLLRIDTRGSYSTRRGLRVDITVPHLVRLDITGSGDADISGLDGDDLELNIDGSGDVQLVGTVGYLDIDVQGSGDVRAVDLSAGEIRTKTKGSGDIELEGTAATLEIELRGSGSIDARRLVAREASAEIYGSGDISVRAEDRFDGAVFGSGDIDVYGDPPRINRRVSGSGDITRH